MPNDTLEKDRSSILQNASQNQSAKFKYVHGNFNLYQCRSNRSKGPTQNQINTAYSGTTLESKVTINTQGIQEWTVPATTTYTIDAYGGEGGGTAPGQGARMKGDFDLQRMT